MPPARCRRLAHPVVRVSRDAVARDRQASVDQCHTLKRTRCRRTFPSWPSTRRRAPVGACRRAWMRRHTENISKYGGVRLAVFAVLRSGVVARVHCTRSDTVDAFDCALAKKKIATTTCDTSDGSLSHCRKMDSTTFSATQTRARHSQGLRCHAIRPCMDTLGKMDAAPLSLPRVGGLGCRVWDCAGG